MPLPRWIEPQLCKLATKAPSGAQWVHEIKLDGYRMAARIEGGRVTLLTRSGLDWTAKYPATAAAIAKLKVRTAYLDGELCGVRPDGVTSFELMQQASDGDGSGLVYFAFDLLELDGEDIARAAAARAQKAVGRRCSESLRQGSPTASMKAATARLSGGRPASMGSKASSRSGSIARICPATVARGSRPNASTGPSSSSSDGRTLKDRDLMSAPSCSVTSSRMDGWFTLAASARA